MGSIGATRVPLRSAKRWHTESAIFSTKEMKEMSRVNLSFAFLSLMTLALIGCGAPDSEEDRGEGTGQASGQSDASNDAEVIPASYEEEK